jgi:hypothetical protein
MRGQGGSIRFTQQEQQMILGARNTGQDLTAVAQKVLGGGQPLTPDQRDKMVKVIDMHANVAKQAIDRISGTGGEDKGGGASNTNNTAEPQPPKAPDPGMKWQHKTTNGQTEWRQVPQ